MWGNGEVGEWGSEGIELKPQNPKTPTPKTCLLTDLKMTMWSQNHGSRWLKSGKGDSPTGKYSRPI
ncbi:hypothetical protein C789_328 [Microcystis aeruginosa FACHB-905 = DIANCHI905]|uniref:Uncharacterized protein n=1 Tax=Microcystis aeruginosa PCC 7806SL TaxID=1903187 RepID=A0AB33BK51_MICA7|nr:hypothetical protein BH695_1771 [Microcystis aeruginosa PCC 7806SL]ELS49881.1 hypothetical protein C789_328 [Microcystis aeruginosa FACHB-905 = DIANCHI905]TRT97964.1 MAG: hypothetical protein EWV61_18175 [Microcystis aeruginosa Ma_AC_P_19900807_S300]